jgi:hypothetical protein
LTAGEIKHKVWISLYARFSTVDKEVLKTGRKRWGTSLSYTLVWLKNTGLIEEIEKKRFILTESGRAYLYNTHISWHFVPGHPAGPFGYTGTQAIRESAEKLPPFAKAPSPIERSLNLVTLKGTISIFGGKPLRLPATVDIVGTAVDSYTGQSTGRMIEASCDVAAKDTGHYTLNGLVPGIYRVYASAVGHPTYVIADKFPILGPSRLDGQIGLT